MAPEYLSQSISQLVAAQEPCISFYVCLNTFQNLWAKSCSLFCWRLEGKGEVRVSHPSSTWVVFQCNDSPSARPENDKHAFWLSKATKARICHNGVFGIMPPRESLSRFLLVTGAECAAQHISPTVLSHPALDRKIWETCYTTSSGSFTLCLANSCSVQLKHPASDYFVPSAVLTFILDVSYLA